ncbi:MAG: glycoside hydrolase [Acetobacteraceae bacterium]
MPEPSTSRLGCLRPVLLLAPLSLIVVLAWWWPNRPAASDVTMPPGELQSVSFAPYRAWQSPLRKDFPSAAEVLQDLRILQGHVQAVRTYSAIEGNYDVAALAQQVGVKVWQGIWLGSDVAQNEREIARGTAIANRYPDTVTRVIVGNEVLLRRDLPPSALIADLEQVKRAVHQPVSYADVWEFWEQFPEVARHVDFVTIHILPYWENHPVPIGQAIAHVRDVYRRIHALIPDKPIVIGEAGWPSRGRWRDGAAPSRVNEARFIREFVTFADRNQIPYNLIEAFDQVWKFQLEGTVGANWGLWTAGRKPKFPLLGPVVENPAWPEDAAIGIVAGILLFAGMRARWPPSDAALVRLAVLAMALGTALSFAWAGTVPVIYDNARLLSAIVNLGGQALLAALLMDRAALILSGQPRPRPRNGLDATETVRAIISGQFRRVRFKACREWLLDDLSFLFLWTAAVMQALLVCDPRYRDFPLAVFAVPVVTVAARAALGDLPASGGGREELLAGLVLTLGAARSLSIEGMLNHQALIWNAAALVLAAPALWSLRATAVRHAAA